jgi:aspartyl-tRNA(Asn)/glutamyl-tRNA(Gln) amidotransferase subunit A
MAPPLADDRTYRVAAALEAALEQRWGGPLLAQAPALRTSGAPTNGGTR